MSRARASSTRRRVGGCAGRLNASGRWDSSPRRGFFIFFYSFFANMIGHYYALTSVSLKEPITKREIVVEEGNPRGGKGNVD